MKESTEVDTRGPSRGSPTAAEMNALTPELHALGADVHELVLLLRARLEAAARQQVPANPSEPLPPLMTIDEAAEELRVSTKALYARINRGDMPGVVRVGARRRMVKTDEFLRGLDRVETFAMGRSTRHHRSP